MTTDLAYMREGSEVIVAMDFGSGSKVTGIVNDVHKDIKNGFPGIDYTIKGTNDSRWAYLDQVVRVTKY